LSEDGAEFSSHIDGSKHFLTPEKAVDIQEALGSDIMMTLDECVHYPAARDYVEQSLALTTRWAKRSKEHLVSSRLPVPHGAQAGAGKAQGSKAVSKQLLFGIVQGSTYLDLRKRAVEELLEIGFDGYAIGGVSVGEPESLIREVTECTAPLLPEDKPRYLMGLGTPPDMLEAIASGADMFDCVVPTRNGRNGQAFTWEGELQLRNAEYKEDLRPIDASCGCYACRHHTRSYIRHLFNTEELLGLRLVSLHNIHFYVKLIQTSRGAIRDGRFLEFKNRFAANYNKRGEKK
jgi:queuine tRNA-ribosyltransferase